MEKVKFLYTMKISFDKPIWNHHFSLNCFPKSNSRQTIDSLSFNLSDTTYISMDTDSFGNTILNGSIMEPHELFYAEISGIAWAGVDIFESRETEWEAPLFSIQSKYTYPGDSIKEYFNEIYNPNNCSNDYETVLKIMHSLYNDMSYVPASTNIKTTAEQAMQNRQGVCQDYAHIMISICRLAGISARYVVGMLEGEGESHAWVEVLCNGVWYGLDPTNDMLVNKSYIKISHGRDFSDCIVSRGVFWGSANQFQTVKVVLQPIFDY